MKVAIVSLGRSHLINLARLLDQKEDVEVMFYTMMPSSRCKQFGYYGKVVSLLFPIGLGEVIIGRIPKINPYKRSALRFRLRRAFDKLVAWRLKKCDVLIGLNGCAVASSLAAKKKFGAITICDQGSSHILKQNAVHYSYSNAPISKDGTDFMLKHYEVVDFFMAPSNYVLQSDVENGIKKDKLLLNPYGVNLSLFKPTNKPERDTESYDVLMVGGWWKHKGCDMLAEACLNKLHISLLHVGSVVDCELPKNPLFHHIPFVPENSLPDYYKKAKIFVMPSLDEGLALVQLQAVASGLPIVYSTRTGGDNIASLLGDPEYCTLIPEPLNVDTIADAIQKSLIIADSMPSGFRKPYGESLYNISWEAYSERWYNILKDLLKK